MEIVYKKLKDITPYEKNARFNDDAVQFVVNSIAKYGFQNPIIVDKNGVIIAGHTRYKAAKELHLKEVPVIVAENLNEEQVKEFRLVDNRSSEFSSWDIDLLSEELASLKGGEELDELFRFSDLTPSFLELETTDTDEEEVIAKPQEKRANTHEVECPACGFVFEVGKSKHDL